MALLTNINGKFSVSDAGAVTFNNAFTFPTTDGTANYVLKTNGSGTVSWSPDSSPTVYWAANGNDIYNTNSANVGIGTDSPDSKLQVVGAGQDQIRFGTSTSVYTDLWMGTGYTVIDSIGGSAGGFDFRDDGTSRMFIDSVGLATFRSTYIVAGLYGGEVTLGGSDTTFGLQLKYNQDAATTSTLYHSPGYSSTGNLFKLGSGSGNTNQLVLKGDGNVGIGVTPEAWASGTESALQIKNSSIYSYSDYEIGLQTNVYYNSGWKYINTSSNLASHYIQSNGNFKWFNAPGGTADASVTFTERMRIDSSGNVTVGNPTYGSSLGQVRIINDAASNPASLSLMGYNNVASGGNYASIDLAMQSSGTGGNVVSSIRGLAVGTGENASDLAFYTATSGTLTERMRIESGGNVRVNFNQSGSTGNVYFQDVTNGASMFYIQPAQYVGTAPYNTNYINAANSSNIGFIAGGSERIRISSLGVVSVGTTSPITDPFVSSNQFQQFQVGKSGVMGSYTNSAGESMFSNNIYVGSTYNTFQALDTSVNGTAMFLYNDYISFKTGTTAANGTVGVAERMRLTNAGELNIGGYGGQFPILKVVGLAGGVHTGSTWSISANQDGIGRTILGTGGQGRAMYFENNGKTVHTQESYFDKGVYLGGSVAANLLDDYEEGTFTATTNNDGVGQPVTARYTKIGQLVTYTVYIPSWSPTSAGTAVIAGFPFTAIITNGYGVGNVTHSTGVLNCSGGYHDGTNWNGTLNNSTGRSSWVVASARSIMVTGFYYTTS